MTRLIILRGNSGSGKSTVAMALRERSTAGRKIALVEQDYLRRHILKEKECDNGDNIGLIRQTVEYALANNYDVILEGILYEPRYGSMIASLIRLADLHWVYYFDVSFEETLRRHSTKRNAHEFGEEEMRAWYKDDDRLGYDGEIIIPESNSFDDTVNYILAQTNL